MYSFCWKRSRSGWMGLWATWSGEPCPYPWQGGTTRWALKVPSTPNLWFLNDSTLIIVFLIFLIRSSLKRSSLCVMSPAPVPLRMTPCPWRGTHLWAATRSFPSRRWWTLASPRTGTAWMAAAPAWWLPRVERRKRSWTASRMCPLIPPSYETPCGRCHRSVDTVGGQGRTPPTKQKSIRGGEWRAALIYFAPTHACLSKPWAQRDKTENGGCHFWLFLFCSEGWR